MCEEATNALVSYLDALEEYDRIHLMFLAAWRSSDLRAIGSHRALLDEVKSKAQTARERFQRHQTVHNCCEIIKLTGSLGI